MNCMTHVILSPLVLANDFAQIYGLIFLGSETAFSSMVSASVIFLVGSYVIPQTLLLFKDRTQVLPERAFDLGRWGYVVNLVSTISTFFLLIACCIPTEYPITRANMNYNRYARVPIKNSSVTATNRPWGQPGRYGLAISDLAGMGILASSSLYGSQSQHGPACGDKTSSSSQGCPPGRCTGGTHLVTSCRSDACSFKLKKKHRISSIKCASGKLCGVDGNEPLESHKSGRRADKVVSVMQQSLQVYSTKRQHTL